MSDALDIFRDIATVSTPLVITHDSENIVKIPENLRYKKQNESWKDYCERLWIGCWKENNNDNIQLTLHLGFLAKTEFLREINNHYNGAINFIKSQGAGTAEALVFAEKLKDTLFGIKVKFDLVEY